MRCGYPGSVALGFRGFLRATGAQSAALLAQYLAEHFCAVSSSIMPEKAWPPPPGDVRGQLGLDRRIHAQELSLAVQELDEDLAALHAGLPFLDRDDDRRLQGGRIDGRRADAWKART